MRTVYLPLSKLDKCNCCEKSNGLRVCSSCAEAIYCSVTCQKADWPSHKSKCGKTDRINIATFYPFLAFLVERCHPHADLPVHPALRHRILNDPNPGVGPCAFPDGSAAKLVVLGDEISREQHMQGRAAKTWWPQAHNPETMMKMSRRIVREGFVLPILMSVCLALLAEVYTTTSGAGSAQRRVRLRYRSAAIADFGIAAGSVDVKNQDKLAYSLPDGELIKGQDPDDHYWIYFTTVNGEEVVLECCMYTFNMCIVIPTGPYLPHEDAVMFPLAPAFLRDRMMNNNTPQMYKERRRFSFLRDEALHTSIRNTESFSFADAEYVCFLMTKIADRPCSKLEWKMLIQWSMQHFYLLGQNLRDGTWKRYPEEVKFIIDGDPKELQDLDSKSVDWYKTMKKWKREHKKFKAGSATQGAILGQ